MANNRGITLIELVIVIAVIAVLAIALGFEFRGWMGSSEIESQTKQIYIDMMNARARAMERNREHFVTVSTNSYSIYEDTNPAPDGNGTLDDPGDALLPSFPKTVLYAITWGGGNITFDNRGLVSPNGTMCVSSTTTKTYQDYDCIDIFQTRIKMGKLTTQMSAGGACAATNCVAR